MDTGETSQQVLRSYSTNDVFFVIVKYSLLLQFCSSVGRYHWLCATVSTVKKYRSTRYYRDGTFAITSTGRPASITGKFRGGAGGHGDGPPKFEVWCRWLYSPIFRKYYYKLTVFPNAYLRQVTMGWICLSSVCEASRPICWENVAS